MTNERYESQIGVLREIILKEFNQYKRELENIEEKKGVAKEKYRNQQEANLTVKEKRGLKKLRKRIQENELVVLKTDKSGKLTVMKREDYYKLGIEDSKGDIEICREEMLRIVIRK